MVGRKKGRSNEKKITGRKKRTVERPFERVAEGTTSLGSVCSPEKE